MTHPNLLRITRSCAKWRSGFLLLLTLLLPLNLRGSPATPTGWGLIIRTTDSIPVAEITRVWIDGLGWRSLPLALTIPVTRTYIIELTDATGLRQLRGTLVLLP